MLVLAGVKTLLKPLGTDMVPNVINGGYAHFHTGVALSEKLDGILFDHTDPSL